MLRKLLGFSPKFGKKRYSSAPKRLAVFTYILEATDHLFYLDYFLLIFPTVFFQLKRKQDPFQTKPFYESIKKKNR